MRILSLLLLTFIMSLPVHGSEMSLYTIPLQHQPPENITATLKPLIPSGGYLTSHGNNIIVRTTPESLAEIELLIEEIDKPLAQLMISVRRGNQYQGGDTQFKVNGKYITDNGGIVIGGNNSSNTRTTTITTRSTTGIGSGNNSYQVRGLEGRPSYIQAGSDVPITTVQSGPYGRPYVNQEYTSANQGFYATPRLFGERVTIAISTQNDKVDNSHRKANGTVINTESISTTVSGRLGEWIAIGGLDNSDNNKATGLTHYRTTKSLSSKTIYLKVERVK